MRAEIASIQLENPEGAGVTMGELLQETDFTVLVFYRGEW